MVPKIQFSIEYLPEGEVKFTTKSFTTNKDVVLSIGDVQHQLNLSVGESFKVVLDKSESCTIEVDGETIHEVSGTSSIDIDSKLQTVQGARDRYISGETWILEFENELESVLQ